MFISPEDVFDDFKEFATIFTIIRDGKNIGTVEGFANPKTHTIETNSHTEIKKNDILIENFSKCRYYIISSEPNNFVNQNYGYILKYSLEKEYNLSENNNKTNNITIQNLYGTAVIGDKNNTTITLNPSIKELKGLIDTKPDEDKEVLNRLLVLLEVIVENNQPIQKGTLAKYSDILAKHSDIIIAIGSFITKWLSQKPWFGF